MLDSVPTFDAPLDGGLSPEMRIAYEDAGVIALRGFVTADECAALRKRALELVDAFDPGSVRTVFTTGTDEHQADDYFIESGDKIRFFLENGAFDAEGRLRQSKEDSLNKIGHAMHDLDPVFDAFSRTPKLASLARSVGIGDPAIIQSMYIFKPPRIGGEVLCHQDSTFIYTEPESCIGFWFALIPPTLMALLQFGWQEALIVLIGYVIINTLVDNVISPKIMGSDLNMSTLVVFLSLIVWGWILGGVGAILAVPLTLMVMFILASFNDSRWLAVLMSEDGDFGTEE